MLIVKNNGEGEGQKWMKKDEKDRKGRKRQVRTKKEEATPGVVWGPFSESGIADIISSLLNCVIFQKVM